MKALLPLLAILLLTVSIVSAQEMPEIPDWTTEQRCITAPSQPPEGWAYDGVIFTFKPGDGVHARRADMETSYYVAFDSDSEFGAAGSLSPDGKWFAVPEGRKESTLTAIPDYWFFINEIRVYSTTPAHETYRIRLERTDRGSSSLSAISPMSWLDNYRFVTEGSTGKLLENREYIVYPFERTMEPYEFPADNLFHVSISPDGTRLIYDIRGSDSGTGYHLTTPEGVVVSSRLNLSSSRGFVQMLPVEQWTDDSSRFAALMQDGLHLLVFDRNGRLLDELVSDDRVSNYSFARDGEQLAYTGANGSQFVQSEEGWLSVPNSGTLYIADFATGTITDTCIKTPYAVAFSPDGHQLAFALREAGYVYILDLEAWEAYRIDLAAADVIGWYPLD